MLPTELWKWCAWRALLPVWVKYMKITTANEPKTRERATQSKQPRQPRRAAEATLALPERSARRNLDSLAQYLGDMQSYDVLAPQQEIALAQAIEQLEVGHFRSLLAHAPALDTVIAALKEHFDLPKEVAALGKLAPPTGSARSLAKLNKALDVAALRLRESDGERTALLEVDAAVRQALSEKPEFEVYLARVGAARAQQRAAKNRFMTANLRLVVMMARRYDRGLLPLADLIQEGNLGLMRAVERFDHTRGFRFSTYASWWIRHHLNRALSDKARLVRLPVHLLDDAQRVARASAELHSLAHEAPSQAELAAKAGVGEEKLAYIQQHAGARHHLSLDRKLGDESDASLLDILPGPTEVEPEAALDAAQWSVQLGQLLLALPPIEASILRFRFGFDDGEELTLREIGLKYNLSRERIRQLQEQALDKLRGELTRMGRGSDSAQHAAA